MRLHKILNGLHGLAVHASGQVQRVGRGNAAPLAIRLIPQRLVVQLDLLGGFNDGGGTPVGPEDITRRVFVGSRKYVHPSLIRMAPRLIDPEKIVGLSKPPGRKRHNRLR